MKLEPNMYVRTKKGIAKIIDRILELDHYYFKMWVTDKFLKINDDTEYISEVDVLKASYNPTDLIEEGDYVNGYEVIEKPYCYHDVCFVSVNSRESWGWGIGEMPMNEIKSIVTKEQFNSMKYEVDSNEFGRIYK